MNSEKPQGIFVAISVITNVILAAALAASSFQARKTVQDREAEHAERLFLIQMEALADVESGDPARLEALKTRLRQSMAVEGRVSYMLRTRPAAKPPRR